MSARDWSSAIKRLKKYRWHSVFFFFFQQICARCVNIDNFSGAPLEAQYRFLFDGRVREWEPSPAVVFTGNVLPLLPNLSKQNQKSQISKWVSDSPYVLVPIFISLVIDRLENSFVRTCAEVWEQHLSTVCTAPWKCGAFAEARFQACIWGRGLLLPCLPLCSCSAAAPRSFWVVAV